MRICRKLTIFFESKKKYVLSYFKLKDLLINGHCKKIDNAYHKYK